MRPATVIASTGLLLSALVLSGCAEPLREAPLIVPRPAPLDPEPPLGSLGPVLGPEATVPYS